MAGKGGAIAGAGSGAASGAAMGSAFGPWGTAIGGVLGGLGGLVGGLRSSDNGPGLGGLVRKARRQGLHPLAVLGSPIAGNFATPTAGRDVGGAISAAGEAFASVAGSMQDRAMAKEAADRLRRQDDLNAARAASEMKVNDAQVRNMDAEALRLIADARRHTVASAANSVRNPAAGEKVKIMGHDWTPGEATNSPTSAQDIENEYGDLAQEIYGTFRALTDLAGGLGVEFRRKGRPTLYSGKAPRGPARR